jgi:hypothetical protein
MDSILKQLLTGKDNNTYDLGRVAWLVGLVAVIGVAAYEMMHGTVSLRELAEAIGIVSGASGVSIMAKKDTEPQ